MSETKPNPSTAVAIWGKRESAELVGLRDRLQSVGRLADDLDVLMRVKGDHQTLVRDGFRMSLRVPAPSV